jgi:hypothetical protein
MSLIMQIYYGIHGWLVMVISQKPDNGHVLQSERRYFCEYRLYSIKKECRALAQFLR